MAENSQAGQNHPADKISNELFAQLRKVPILSSLKDDELHCVEGVGEIHIAPNEVIARQGDIAHSFWILLEGELRLTQKQPDGRSVTLATIEPGNAFGELPLLTNVPFIASV